MPTHERNHACSGLPIHRTQCPCRDRPHSGCAVWARHDCFGSRGCSGLAMPLPRTQSSRRGQRTAASARRCTSRAVRGRRRPPRHWFPDGVGRPPGQEQSSCLGHARDRNARNPITPRSPVRRSLRCRVRRGSGRCLRPRRKFAMTGVLAAGEQAKCARRRWRHLCVSSRVIPMLVLAAAHESPEPARRYGRRRSA